MSDSLTPLLFGSGDWKLYAIVDGACVLGLLDKLYDLVPPFECLYRGELEPDMAEVAPYLVRLQPGEPFTSWLLAHGWGRHWGMFVRSGLDLDGLRRHFRKFLIVHDTDGKPYYFRFYDPRVLRVYLPTCNQRELETFFGPVTAFLAENGSPKELLVFEVIAGSLRKEQRTVNL